MPFFFMSRSIIVCFFVFIIIYNFYYVPKLINWKVLYSIYDTSSIIIMSRKLSHDIRYIHECIPFYIYRNTIIRIIISIFVLATNSSLKEESKFMYDGWAIYKPYKSINSCALELMMMMNLNHTNIIRTKEKAYHRAYIGLPYHAYLRYTFY